MKPEDLKNHRSSTEAIGLAVWQLDAHMQGHRQWPVLITGFTVRAPRYKDDEFLVTLRGVDAEGEYWVAFHSAFDLGGAIRGAQIRAKNGKLKWKEDQYAPKGVTSPLGGVED